MRRVNLDRKFKIFRNTDIVFHKSYNFSIITGSDTEEYNWVSILYDEDESAIFNVGEWLQSLMMMIER